MRSSADQREVVMDHRWALLAALVPIAVFLDQLTKHIAHESLAGRIAGAMPVIDGLFMLRYSRNRGAFFSLGEGLPDSIRVIFFATAALVALAFIALVYRRAATHQRRLRWGLLLLAAGAIGNLVDRLLYGEVIDFLHLHYADHFHWATFNVADIYITFGVILLIWDAFRAPAPHASNTIGMT